MQRAERKTRSDKGTRVNPNLPPKVHKKLRKLALACGVSKTSLAGEIIEIAMNSPEFVNLMQDMHGTDREDRLIPLVGKGNCCAKTPVLSFYHLYFDQCGWL